MSKKVAVTYNQIYEYDLELIKNIQTKYKGDEKTAWSIFYEFYQDPDIYPTEETGYKTINGIECTADALLSIKRIYKHEGFGEPFLETYKKYRKAPIFFFPPEKGGINQYRSYQCVFGDRIDYTMFDIKKYLDTGKKADGLKLESAFKKEKTKKWLDGFKSFDDFVSVFKLDGSFTQGGKVINIEDQKEITKYPDPKDFKQWPDDYYKNLKMCMDKWYNKEF